MLRVKRFFTGLLKYIILGLIILIGVWYWNNRTVEEEPEAVIPDPVVETIRPELSSIRRVVSSGGVVEPESMVTVLPQVGGRLDELLVEEGDTIDKGELIGKIDTTSYQLQVDQAEAAYISAESSFKRVESLFATGAATKQTYDQTKAQYEAYLSQYELAQLQLSYTEIMAPVSGTVLIRQASEGSLVGPQVPIVTVSDLQKLLVKISIPEIHYDEFTSPGTAVEISLHRPDLPQRVLSGRVVRVAPLIDPATKTFEVTCSLDQPDGITPGMYLDADCVLEEITGVYVLPYATFASEGTLWYVDEKTSTAHQRRISPEASDDVSFVIPAEMRDYLFIIDGQHFLKEGQHVSMTEERE